MATPTLVAGSARQWSRRTEQISLGLHPLLLREAQKNSRGARNPTLLMGLAREIALSRGPELTLAYRNVVMVTAGFKKKRRGEQERLTRQPCVVFVVRRKWTRADDMIADPLQQLPRWLVTFAEHDGRRLPYALPTDVQHESGFRGAKAHAASGWLRPPGVAAEHGSAASAVQLHSTQGTRPCLLSAQHVLTPKVDVQAMNVTGGLPMHPFDARGRPLPAPQLATTLPFGGVLRGEQDPLKPSFDVQLAQFPPDQLVNVRALVGAPRLFASEPWVRTPERLWELGATRFLHLVVPANNPNAASLERAPMKAVLDAPLTQPQALQYTVRRGDQLARVQIYHDELLKLQVQAPSVPVSGDSGCAVVIRQPGNTATLVGMYIGGTGNVAYAIPSWQLFDKNRWFQLPAGAQLAPASL
jgi:hypothetical protein